MITDKEIEEVGWESTTVLVPKECTDNPTSTPNEEDVYTDGWQIDYAREDTTDPWWEMCRRGKQLVIVKKWYRNSVGQSWDTVMECSIEDKKDLLVQMDWLGIKPPKSTEDEQ